MATALPTKPSAESLMNALAAGRTVTVHTSTRVFPVSPKTAKAFADVGITMFREGKTGSLYMASGRTFLCIDYAAITVA